MVSKKPRILLVDDDRTNLRLLGAMLESDYEVSVATSGEQALRLLASKLTLDVLLLDIQMPDMSGVEVAKTLRASTERYGDNAAIPIVAITASARHDECEEYRQAGINGVLQKPVSPDALGTELRRWLA